MAFAPGPAINAASPNVDLESLLWEVRDLLRGLGQINASQASQLSQLSATTAADDTISAEYAERTRVAIGAVDTLLDQLHFSEADEDLDDLGEGSQCDDSRVRLWLHDTQCAQEHQPQETPLSSALSPSPGVADLADFWTTDTSFKWDEEPAGEETYFDFASCYSSEEYCEFGDATSNLDDDAVDPSDSISMRDAASDSDDESEFSFEEVDDAQLTSSGNDSATLFYSEPRHSIASQPHNKYAISAKLGSPTAADLFAAHPDLLAGF